MIQTLNDSLKDFHNGRIQAIVDLFYVCRVFGRVFEIILRREKYWCEEQITLDAMREELINNIGMYEMDISSSR